jgi:hypothetical protein
MPTPGGMGRSVPLTKTARWVWVWVASCSVAPQPTGGGDGAGGGQRGAGLQVDAFGTGRTAELRARTAGGGDDHRHDGGGEHRDDRSDERLA